VSEPHWHTARAETLLGMGPFERVLASVYSAPAVDSAGFTEVPRQYTDQPPDKVVRAYLPIPCA